MSNAIGVIGGADGPTAIFMATNNLLPLLIGVGVLAVLAVGAVIFIISRRGHDDD